MSNQSLVDTEVFSVPYHPQPGAQSISSAVEVDFGGLSDQGKVRTNNEDTFFIGRFDRTMQVLQTNLPIGSYPSASAETTYGMLVADGMGGHAAGEVASRTAIHVMLDLVLQTPDWIMRLDESSADKVVRRTEERVQKIQEALTERAQAEPRLSGMGTTLTLAVSNGAELLIAHVGDSRAYRFRQGKLQQLTRDQTVAQDMMDAGLITAEEAVRHRMRHVLTGFLSTLEKNVPVECAWFKLADGDQVLLCSDGLTEMVAESDLEKVLLRTGAATDICRDLIELALEAGGKDNVTVVLARYRIPEHAGA